MSKQLQCCICFEFENASACITCHFCIDGILCYECFVEYEYENIVTCPICRSILIMHSIRNILLNALLYNEGVLNSDSLLHQRWKTHFKESPYYSFIFSD